VTRPTQDVTKTIFSIYAFFWANGLLFGVWASRIPAIRDRYELSSTTLGLLLLCVAFGAVSAMVFTGRIVDRFGTLRLSRSFAWAMIATFVLIGFAPNVYVLAFVLTIMGFTGGGLDVAMNALASDLEKASKRSLMSRFHGMWSVGTTMGATSGLVTLSLGFATITHIMLTSIFAAVVVFAIDRGVWENSTVEENQSSTPFRFPTGALGLVCLFAFVTFLGEGVIMDWGSIYLIDIFDAPKSVGAAGLLVFTSTMMVVRFVGDPFIDRFGTYNSARAASITATIGALIIFLAPNVWFVFLGYFILGVGFSIMAPLAFSQAGKIEGVSTGQAMSSVAVLGYGSLLVGPPTVGIIADILTLRAAFLGLAILCAILIVTSKVFKPK
jgi:MFS family permease